MTPRELADELRHLGKYVSPSLMVDPNVAAEIIGVSEKTLANWRSASEIDLIIGPPWLKSGRIQYSLEDLVHYLDQQKRRCAEK